MNTQARAVMQQAQWLITRQKEWIHAVPQDTVLPAMPGFDGDYADSIEAAISKALTAPALPLAAPASEMAAFDRWFNPDDSKNFKDCWKAACEFTRKNLAAGRAQPEPASRPQNCGTGFCSCIECLYPSTKEPS